MLHYIRTSLTRNSIHLIEPRPFSLCRRLLAQTVPDSELFQFPELDLTEYNQTKNKHKRNVIWKQLDDEYSYLSLETIDRNHHIFNESTTKIVDIGYVPGNWMRYTIDRLSQLHDIEREKLYKKCYILGVDILFQTPPDGVSTIQGNIFSRFTHKMVINQLMAWTQSMKQHKNVNEEEETTEEIDPKSYITKEQEEQMLEHKISEIETKMKGLTLDEYRADIVLSDLSRPFIQATGYYNNSMTTPYLRSLSNQSLNQTISDPSKACIDLADAALMLTCSALKPGGTFVLRLGTVENDDKEVQKRLEMVFTNVQLLKSSGRRGFSRKNEHEMYYVCRNKRDDVDYEIKTIFNLH